MGEQVVINCVGWGATIREGWPAGAYLASYDPEGNHGRGDSSWTAIPAKALVFDNATAAMELYRAIPANRPVRADGKPNRPLTALAIELVPADRRAQETIADVLWGSQHA